MKTTKPMNTGMLIASALIASVMGCATLESDSETSAYGPDAGADNKSGRVSYNPNGLEELVKGRRNSALKKIYKFCGDSNAYKITSEKTVDKASLSGDSLAIAGANQVQILEFTCN